MSEALATKAQTGVEERPPWHKPEVQHLTISLDTHVPKTGSGEDLDVFQPYSPSPG